MRLNKKANRTDNYNNNQRKCRFPKNDKPDYNRMRLHISIPDLSPPWPRFHILNLHVHYIYIYAVSDIIELNFGAEKQFLKKKSGFNCLVKKSSEKKKYICIDIRYRFLHEAVAIRTTTRKISLSKAFFIVLIKG